MLSTKIWNRCLVRTFTRSVVRKDLDKTKTPETTSTSATTPTAQPKQQIVGAQDLVQDFIPTNWDKKLLMWSGKYKTPEDIPRRISISSMNAIKSQLRIKIATVLMVLVLIGCFTLTRIGKEKAARGDTLFSRERERENRIREERRQALAGETVK